MSKLIFVLLLCGVLGADVQAQPEKIEIVFESPAAFEGKTSLNVEWALLVFDDTSSGVGSFDFDGLHAEIQRNSVFVRDPVLKQEVPVIGPSTPGRESAFVASGNLEILHRASSVLLVGQIKLQSVGSGVIVAQDGETCLNSHVGPALNQEGSARFSDHCLPARISLDADGQDHVWLETEALEYVETHNVAFSCEGNSCPTSDRTEVNVVDGTSIQTLRFHSFNLAKGSVKLDVANAFLVAGGNAIDVSVNGTARLPLALGSCHRCPANAQTWTIEGPMGLANLASRTPNKVSGDMTAEPISLRLDESLAGPHFLDSVAKWSGASVGVLLMIKFLIAPFFTRLSKEQALEHPRRKQIFEYIQQHPGANFREVARETGIAAGTVRHHLNVLGRSDIILEHQHGATVRLFENVSRFQTNWSDQVLLREPALGELYAWLKANPGAPQKAVLEGMEPAGWSRSTTQHRLSRLVDGGLANIKLQGRLKIYTAVDRASRPSGPPPFGMPSPT